MTDKGEAFVEIKTENTYVDKDITKLKMCISENKYIHPDTGKKMCETFYIHSVTGKEIHKKVTQHTHIDLETGEE